MLFLAYIKSLWKSKMMENVVQNEILLLATLQSDFITKMY
jgi:hypothetical protein